jgi:transposase
MKRDRFDHKVDLTFDPKDLRRVEVITGVGRRRSWPHDFKMQVVAETLETDAVISDVARRHGLRPQQLFSWRNQFRSGQFRSGQSLLGKTAPRHVPAFATVVVAPSTAADAPPTLAAPVGATKRDPIEPSAIEIVIKGVVIRLHGGVDAAALTAVLRAVRAT